MERKIWDGNLGQVLDEISFRAGQAGSESAVFVTITPAARFSTNGGETYFSKPATFTARRAVEWFEQADPLEIRRFPGVRVSNHANETVIFEAYCEYEDQLPVAEGADVLTLQEKALSNGHEGRNGHDRTNHKNRRGVKVTSHRQVIIQRKAAQSA